MVLYLGRRCNDDKGNWNDPESRQCHMPFKEEQAQCNQDSRNHRADQFRNEVRKCRFQRCTVCHHGAGQIGKVFFPEKGKRNFPQFFCKMNPANTRFYIGCQKSRIILKISDGTNQCQTNHNSNDIESGLCSGNTAIHQILYQQIEQTNRKHENDILQCTTDNRLD